MAAELRASLTLAGLDNLPSGWEVVSMESLLADDRPISVGVMYPGDHDEDGVPLIKAGDLSNNRINPRPEFRITQDKHVEYKRSELRGGEILMTLVGAVGQCDVVPVAMAGWNVARAIAVIRLADPSDAHWVVQCLRSPALQHLMDVWCNTTVQATLNLKEIRQLPIPMPPKPTRDAIAGVLGALDDKIEVNRRMARTLEAAARALFESWFVRFEHATTKATTPHTIDSPLGPNSKVPDGWQVMTPWEAFEVNPTRTLPRDSDAAYLDMSNMPTQGHAPKSWVRRAVGSGMKFMNGDTLVARITPCLENGKTAFVDFLKDGEVGWGSTEYIVMRPKMPLPLVFAYCLARSDEFRTFAIRQMSGSSGRQRVPAESLRQFFLAVPPAPIAEEFGRVVEPIFGWIKTATEQNRVLSAMRDALLPKLISGDLEIPNHDAIVIGGA